MHEVLFTVISSGIFWLGMQHPPGTREEDLTVAPGKAFAEWARAVERGEV